MHAERVQGAPGRLGLADPPVRQWALVIWDTVDGLGVTQEPEHAHTVRRALANGSSPATVCREGADEVSAL